MNHIMFDLETLGNNSRAPIVQLAAVLFDEKNEGEVLKSFNRRIALGDDFSKFEFDVSTLEWWISQTGTAKRNVFTSQGRMGLEQVLKSFVEWLAGIEGDKRYWSHATFDPPILKHAFTVMKVENKMDYRDFMDIRTLQFMAGKSENIERMKYGEPHDAIADCKYQAAYVSDMMRRLR